MLTGVLHIYIYIYILFLAFFLSPPLPPPNKKKGVKFVEWESNVREAISSCCLDDCAKKNGKQFQRLIQCSRDITCSNTNQECIKASASLSYGEGVFVEPGPGREGRLFYMYVAVCTHVSVL